MYLRGILSERGMKTITKHYIDGASVESHGREVMDIIGPTDSQVIGRVTLEPVPSSSHKVTSLSKHATLSRPRLRIASQSGSSLRPTRIAPIAAMRKARWRSLPRTPTSWCT